MDDTGVDEVRSARWRRWNKNIFRALARSRQLGLATRSASGRGDLYMRLFDALAAYRALSASPPREVDRRGFRRFLVAERRDIRGLVRRIRAGGDRVWWSARRDGTGVDLLIAGEAWSPVAPEPSAAHPGR